MMSFEALSQMDKNLIVTEYLKLYDDMADMVFFAILTGIVIGIVASTFYFKVVVKC